jgi:hypothetical protein
MAYFICDALLGSKRREYSLSHKDVDIAFSAFIWYLIGFNWVIIGFGGVLFGFNRDLIDFTIRLFRLKRDLFRFTHIFPQKTSSRVYSRRAIWFGFRYAAVGSATHHGK